MTARQLWWELTKHLWHRRGNDEVFVAVSGTGWDAFGAVTEFRWEDDADAFCTIDADHDAELLFDEPLRLTVATDG